MATKKVGQEKCAQGVAVGLSVGLDFPKVFAPAAEHS